MSNAKQLYKGKPSKLVPVFEADDVFVEAVYCKPPSALSRSVWMEQLMVVGDLKESSSSIKKMASMAIDLILITSCDDTGKPFFDADDREFLENELDGNYHDIMVKAACDMMGNIPSSIIESMLMDLLINDEDDNKENDKDEDEEETKESLEKSDTE